jgi:hypothetical protein
MTSDPRPRRRYYPQRLQYAFVQVGGQPEAEFRPYPLRLIAGIVVGLVAVAGGLWLCLFGISEEESGLIVTGLVVAGFGLALAWGMYRVWGEQLYVCPGGLVRRRGARLECRRWADVKEMVQKEGTSSYRLVPRKGDDWTLDANHTQQIDDLIARIRRLSENHSITWTVEKKKSK